MWQDGVGMRIYHTRPVPFNFLNETWMRIVLNKWDEVGMGATHPKPAPLPFPCKCLCLTDFLLRMFLSTFNCDLPSKFHYPNFKKEKRRGFHYLNKWMHFQEEASHLI